MLMVSRSHGVWKLSVFYLQSKGKFLNVSHFWRSHEATSGIFCFWGIIKLIHDNEVLKNEFRRWFFFSLTVFWEQHLIGWQRNLCSANYWYSSWLLCSCRLRKLPFLESCSVSVPVAPSLICPPTNPTPIFLEQFGPG